MTKADIEGLGNTLLSSVESALAGDRAAKAAAHAGITPLVNLCVDINRIAQAHEIIANHLESL